MARLSKPRHRRWPHRPLRDRLRELANAALHERGLTYKRVAYLCNVDVKTLHSTLVHNEQKMSADALTRVLYVLGYECVLYIRERERNEDEVRYIAKENRSIPANLQATITDGKNPDVTIRVLD